MDTGEVLSLSGHLLDWGLAQTQEQVVQRKCLLPEASGYIT